MSTTEESIDLEQANEELLSLSSEDRIRWAIDQFGLQAVLLSSMQKTASAMMHLFHRLNLENEILFVDTGFHFHETLQVRDEFMRRYHLNVMTLYPKKTPEDQERLYGRKLYLFVDGQPECCRLRKEVPFIDHVKQKGHRLVMLGLRQGEGGKRKNVQPISVDPRFDGYVMYPILDWTTERLESYLAEHDVPIHPLHAENYPSIGCAPCTTPVAPGEDPRAGRWRHLREAEGEGPKYCGINFVDGSGI
ncbi:phosphoadenylyl-sulfate reductase [Kolteria novifilia]|uniref:phosphoadenylyl-sulfate reductase n=1 Tax=Kolteria novifilia TaxID=2527975 RepID=UPI003AF3E2E4